MMRFIHVVTTEGGILLCVANAEQLIILARILEASPNVKWYQVTEPDAVHMGAWCFGHGGSGFNKWKPTN